MMNYDPEIRRALALLDSSDELIERVKNRPHYTGSWLKEPPRAPPLAEVATVPPSNWRRGAEGHLEKSAQAVFAGRLIHGIASSSTVNEHGYAMISHGMELDLPVPLLCDHKGYSTPIGEIFYVRKSASRVYVRASVFDNEAGDLAWSLIKTGELRCFSGAAKARSLKLQGIVDDKKIYGEWRLHEVSMCRRGANPDSVFEIWNGADDGQKFFVIGETIPKIAEKAHEVAHAQIGSDKIKELGDALNRQRERIDETFKPTLEDQRKRLETLERQVELLSAAAGQTVPLTEGKRRVKR